MYVLLFDYIITISFYKKKVTKQVFCNICMLHFSRFVTLHSFSTKLLVFLFTKVPIFGTTLLILPALLSPDFVPSPPVSPSSGQAPTVSSYKQIPDNTFPIENVSPMTKAFGFSGRSGFHRIPKSTENHDLSGNSGYHSGTQP